MRLHLSFWLLLAGLTCFAQNQFEPLSLTGEDRPEKYLLPVKDSIFDQNPEDAFVTCFVMESFPEFKGGMKGLNQYLREHLKYPPAAIAQQVTGTVFVGFTVRNDGSVTDVRVLKGIGYGCDEEALSVIQAMPFWKPGTQSGRPVSVKYSLPIRFPLPDDRAKNPRKRFFPLPFRRTFSR